LGLRQFFLHFFPLRTEEALNEEVFALTYCMNGVTYTDVVEKMSSRERVWFLKRLNEQIKMESEEIKKGSKGGPKMPRIPKRGKRR
jgi:hypothetical protein